MGEADRLTGRKEDRRIEGKNDRTRKESDESGCYVLRRGTLDRVRHCRIDCYRQFLETKK